ncbi:lipoprotein [Spiroplasma endosymbiont of Amphibalanus improvisus]|uniref:lipoprotein n=1 Tax=Spiroplasma endosymbiont of Amphibalanus improvisus TaxID=3066327 RepID=UPI00313ED432
MKKLVSFLGSLSIAVVPAVSVISCSDDNFYNSTFLPELDQKRNAVIYVGADDCPFCEDFYYNIWKDHFDTPELASASWSEIYNDPSSLHRWPDYGKEDFKEIDFLHYQVESEESAYEDDSVKSMSDWIVNWYKDFNSNNDNYKNLELSREDIGLDGLPLFIFIHDGEFSGFQVGAPDKYQEFIGGIFHYLIYGDFTTDPVPSPPDPDAE